MRTIISVIALLSLGSCKPCKTITLPAKTDTVTVVDTLYLFDEVTNDSLISVINRLRHYGDSAKVTADTLAARLLYAKLTINNIHYYWNLAAKNSSQRQFLVGWLRRPLEQYKSSGR